MTRVEILEQARAIITNQVHGYKAHTHETLKITLSSLKIQQLVSGV